VHILYISSCCRYLHFSTLIWVIFSLSLNHHLYEDDAFLSFNPRNLDSQVSPISWLHNRSTTDFVIRSTSCFVLW